MMFKTITIPAPSGRPIFDEERSFWGAIGDTPVEDGAPRLIYADWLEENGFADQSAFVRAHVELIGACRDLLRDVRGGVDRLDGEAILHGKRLREIERAMGLRPHNLIVRLRDRIGEFWPSKDPAEFDTYYQDPRLPFITHHAASWMQIPEDPDASEEVCQDPREVDLGLFSGDAMDEDFFSASFDPRANWVEAAIRDPLPWKDPDDLLGLRPPGGTSAFFDGWLVVDSRKRIWSIPASYPFMGRRSLDPRIIGDRWMIGYLGCHRRRIIRCC